MLPLLVLEVFVGPSGDSPVADGPQVACHQLRATGRLDFTSFRLRTIGNGGFARLETEPVRLGFANQSIKTIYLNHLDDKEGPLSIQQT